jgi:cephalosporin-C deacetylase
MKKTTSSIIIFLLTVFICQAQNLLPEIWKFSAGDNPEYAQASFNDSGWKTLIPGTVWEKQGYPALDGYAWYRVTFVIPSSMKKDALHYGGLVVSLGRIDDSDETFFNGGLIGATGTMPPHHETAWNTLRTYSIPADKILWGKPNTLAVRVYDSGGDGGIYSDPIEINPRGIPDFFTFSTAFIEKDRIFKGSPDVTIPLSLKNDYKKDYAGTVSVKVVSDFGDEIASITKEIVVKKHSTGQIAIPLTGIAPGFYKVTARIKNNMATKQIVFNFGYEPEKIVSPADPQPDFQEFWAKAKKELAAVDPQYKLIKIDSLCTEKHNVYLVEMRSLGNALIRGWYQVPVKPGRYPAIMQVPGYSTTIVPAYVNYGDDFIGFGLNIRGHGNSKDDVNPGFPGYILTNLEDKEKYIYRGAYMDCVRGIDFLFSRPEVDITRVAVEGASQGGALTYATAALNNDRIKVCVPQVPFLSDFQHYFKVATWPGNEFTVYVEKEKRQTWDEVFKSLSYFDIKNLAPMIKAPLLMGVGLKDDVCPPHINFAAYNNVKSEKAFIAYPESGHGLPQDFYTAKMNWIRKYFGMSQADK